MLFRKPDCDEEHTLEMSPNTKQSSFALAKDLPINSDQKVEHQKWFSSTYLQTWWTEDR